jgi:hypothetical protein
VSRSAREVSGSRHRGGESEAASEDDGEPEGGFERHLPPPSDQNSRGECDDHERRRADAGERVADPVDGSAPVEVRRLTERGGHDEPRHLEEANGYGDGDEGSSGKRASLRDTWNQASVA